MYQWHKLVCVRFYPLRGYHEWGDSFYKESFVKGLPRFLLQWYIPKLLTFSPYGNQKSRAVPVHRSPCVLLLRNAFDRDDQYTIGAEDNSHFCSSWFEHD
jgi:hypothetical protein